jgi:hypothetical protein
MDQSNQKNTSQSQAEPLQKQDTTLSKATTRIMSMPGKSTRPLKKRRIVSVEPEEPVVDSPLPQTCIPKAKKRKAKRARTAKKQNNNVDRTLSPSAMSMMKKSVTWNDPGGNRVHLQPDPTQVYPFFNESDLWYTVSHVMSSPSVGRISDQLIQRISLLGG